MWLDPNPVSCVSVTFCTDQNAVLPFDVAFIFFVASVSSNFVVLYSDPCGIILYDSKRSSSLCDLNAMQRGLKWVIRREPPLTHQQWPCILIVILAGTYLCPNSRTPTCTMQERHEVLFFVQQILFEVCTLERFVQTEHLWCVMSCFCYCYY